MIQINVTNTNSNITTKSPYQNNKFFILLILIMKSGQGSNLYESWTFSVLFTNPTLTSHIVFNMPTEPIDVTRLPISPPD
jgi:hypothetical protein